MGRRQGHCVTDDEMTRGPASMTQDDVTVTLDAAIRAATEKARQDATSEFARDGTEGPVQPLRRSSLRALLRDHCGIGGPTLPQ